MNLSFFGNGFLSLFEIIQLNILWMFLTPVLIDCDSFFERSV